MSLSDKITRKGNITAVNVKEFIKEIIQVFHIGVLYEGKSIEKIIKEKAGKEFLE